MKMILKVLYLSLIVISMAALLQLTGCVVPGGEQAFGYQVYIENRSGREVVSCYDFTDFTCSARLKDGESDIIPYVLREDASTIEKMSAVIGRRRVIICGVVVPIKDILSIASLEKYDYVDFKLIIDSRVSDLFCH